MSLHLELGSSLRRMVQTEHTVRFRTDRTAFFQLAYRFLHHETFFLCLRLLLLFRSRFRYGSLRLYLCRTGGSRSILFLRSRNRFARPQIIQVDASYDFRPLSEFGLGRGLDLHRLLFGKRDGRFLFFVLPLTADDSSVVPQSLVLLELGHQHLILFVRDFGVGIGFHVAETLFLQELDGCLQPYITFFGYFI